MTTLKTPVSNKALFDLLYQSYVPKIINAAIDIDLFQALSKAPVPLPMLCDTLNTNQAITQALLDVLIATRLAEKQGDNYTLSPAAQDFLIRESETNQIHSVKEFPGSSGPFDKLTEVLRNGPAPFNERMWSSKESVLNMEQGQKGGAIQAVLSFVRDLPQFAACRNMCDFAGNIGYFSFALMQANKTLCAHVYDLPEVCTLARELKKDQKNFHRILFHNFDLEKDTDFGSGYDLFLSSHFLYEMTAKDQLKDFLIRVNRAMVPGGIFISNHVAPPESGAPGLTSTLLELMTRCMGYPTHHLPEKELKAALTHAGFGSYTARRLDTQFAYPVLMLAGVKETEV